jgi:Fe-S cluster biosynthesis and repair protein YggX
MTHMVNCRKYGQSLEGLDAPPFPGPAGEEIFNTVSKRAWLEWMALQTRLINEKQLRMSDAAARKFLTEQRQKFLANATDVEEAVGYVPPTKQG